MEYCNDYFKKENRKGKEKQHARKVQDDDIDRLMNGVSVWGDSSSSRESIE